MSGSRHDVISIVGSIPCPSNCSDYASAHRYFPDTIVIRVGNVDVTRTISSNVLRILKIGTNRQDVVTIIGRIPCPSNCSDYTSAYCHFSDTIVSCVSEVEVATSINCDTIICVYFGTCRCEIISMVAYRSITSNCKDELIQSVYKSSVRLIDRDLPDVKE